MAPAGRTAGFRTRRLLITGMAGVGKTALALQVAHAVAGEFPDGLLHARLRNEDGTVKDSAEVLVRLLRALGGRSEDMAAPDAPDRLDDLIHRYRTRAAGRRPLILLDDAAGELQLDALLPPTTDAAVLVTSRNRLTALPGSRTVVLEPMGASESLALLATIAGKSLIVVEPEAADVIVRACAGLPLALRAAAIRLAARPHRPAARLVRRHRPRAAARLGELRTGDLDVGRVLGSALRARPHGERHLAGVPASAAGGTFTAAEAAGEAGLSEDTAEELLER
ncbi:NB-ARC domain-containing protein, partial [Streptomyces sp. 12257]